MRIEIEERIARIAREQHGVVTRRQLYAAGLTRRMVDRRLSHRWLRLLHRGVYGVGPIAALREREMAAVLASGQGARVSHASAGWLWQIAPEPAPGAPVQVKVPGHKVVRRPGIRGFRALALEAEEFATVDGVPVTSPISTLVDLSALLEPRAVERAVASAERSQLIRLDALAREVAALRGRPGVAVLARVLSLDPGPAFTRSVLEEQFLDAARLYGLPAPLLNRRIGRHEVDCYWPAARLVVELDGQAYHGSWASRASDRARDADLAARGIRVIRITWDRLTREQERTMMQVGQALVVGAPVVIAPGGGNGGS